MRPSGFPVPRRAAVAALCLAASLAGGTALAQPNLEARLRQIEARLGALEARLSQTGAPAAATRAAGRSVAGAWDSDFGRINLMEVGDGLEGNYPSGRIIGRMQGDVLVGHWIGRNTVQCRTLQHGADRWGRLEFRYDAERRSFLGSYGYCDEAPSTAWNGKRPN